MSSLPVSNFALSPAALHKMPSVSGSDIVVTALLADGEGETGEEDDSRSRRGAGWN
jgi:hypothetical protein